MRYAYGRRGAVTGKRFLDIGAGRDLWAYPLFERVVWSEIDREARKGKPTPSDHAPLLMDVDEPGHPLDAGWSAAAGRIAARRTTG